MSFWGGFFFVYETVLNFCNGEGLTSGLLSFSGGFAK